MITEKGFLKDTPVMKLLLAIFEQGATGTLYLKHRDVLKLLYFSRGKLIWAISNSEEDKLEKILLSENLVDSAALLRVKKESHVSESIGKLLVEKGLITLEELIDSSREQLKRIILDVLKWPGGGFQFVKEAPPGRLLSLDLDITNFIIDYIVEEMDSSEVRKTVDSLQIELVKNPDKEKLAKYQLSERQLELLNSFDGKTKLEDILSRHANGHRESLLKIIYFFLMAELLIKKEFDLTDSQVLETDHDFEEAAAGPSVPDVEKGESPVETAKQSEDIETDTGSYEEDTDVEMALYQEAAASANLFSPGGPGHEEPGVVRLPGEKKRIKLFNVILILIFLILVIGGVILLLIPWLENEHPIGNMAKKTETGDLAKKEAVTPPESAARTGTEANALTSEPGDKKEELKQPEEKRTEPLAGKTAYSYFLEGNLITAGDVWKRELSKAGIKYSILLELDCQKASVIHAYNRIKIKKDFFILNRIVGERTCFLVMWGKFHASEEAAKVIKLIPTYFWQQKDPPEVVELSPYL
jgi:hypothetical protein